MKNKQNQHSGIPFLALWIAILYGCGLYIQSRSEYNFLMMTEYLNLKPKEILSGEITRVFTWLLVPSSMHGGKFIYSIIKLVIFTFAGYVLERVFNRRKYNVFMIRGLILTLLASFALYGSGYIWSNEQGALELSMMYIPAEFSTIYVMMSNLLMMGILLVRKNLRNYKPNLVVGIISLVLYCGMLIFELITAYQFSPNGFVIACVAVSASWINVLCSSIRVKRRKNTAEALETEEFPGLKVFRKVKTA